MPVLYIGDVFVFHPLRSALRHRTEYGWRKKRQAEQEVEHSSGTDGKYGKQSRPAKHAHPAACSIRSVCTACAVEEVRLRR
eukprot:scaffold407127_cov47-Prasinocladus_malaysianus.AAC.1